MGETNTRLQLGLRFTGFAVGQEALLTANEVADTANAILKMYYVAHNIPQRFDAANSPEGIGDQLRRADLIEYARKIARVLDRQAPIEREDQPKTWYSMVERSYHDDVSALGDADREPRPGAPTANYMYIPGTILNMAEVTVDQLRAVEV